jgi:uncharacterized membrane protein YfcA
MIELLCGILIGIVMGLTGAGGALVAIPLFMQLMGQSLKEASLYSLVAVVLASLLNFLTQKSFTQYKTGLLIVISSAVGSYFTAPFKASLSSFWIAIILSIVSLYALYSVWFPVEIKSENLEDRDKSFERFWLSIAVGLSLGALTTFTGLGGGVLMLPIFLGLYHFKQPNAVATSLFAVGLSSLSSLIIQIDQGADFKLGIGFIYLLAGILAAVFLLKRVSRHLRFDVLIKLRQIVFSIVVLLALAKVLNH